MARIEYRGAVSPELFCRAQWLHIGWGRSFLWAFPFVMGALAWFQKRSLGIALLAAVIGCAFPIAMSWLTVRQWRRLHRDSPHFREPVSAAITEDGIEFSSTMVSGRLPWSALVKMKEQDDLILVYQAPNLFSIVSPQFFETPASWAAARDILRAHISKAT